MSIGESQVQQFFDDGFVIVENLYTHRELQPAMDEIVKIVDEYAEKLYRAGKIKDKHEGEDFYTCAASLERKWPGTAALIHNKEPIRPRLAELWSSDKLLDVMQALLGPDVSGHPVSCLRVKTPDTPLMNAPWHQDAAVFAADSDQTLRPTAWVPFIDATAENGCMQVIRGGHRGRRVFPHHHHRRIGHPKSWYLYIEDEDLPAGEVMTCEVPMGGALFHMQLTPHRSTPNTTNRVRWSVDFRYQRPGEPMGYGADAEPGSLIPFRRSGKPDYRVDWSGWIGGSQLGTDGFYGDTSGEFDFAIDGEWMERWGEAET